MARQRGSLAGPIMDAAAVRFLKDGYAGTHMAKVAEEAAKRRVTRTWTAADGESSVKAEFVSYGQGKVKLRKEDRTTVNVEVEKLSDEDKDFLRKHFRERGLKANF